MNKKLFIIASLLIIIFLMIGVFFFSKLNQSLVSRQSLNKTIHPTPSPVEIPTPYSRLKPTNNREIIINTKNSQIVTIKNIYLDPESRIFDKKNDVAIKETADYHIIYFTDDGGGFLISILDGNPQTTRNIAEQELLNKLGITENDACLLEVMVYISKDINPLLAGQDYGLSFCPNGILLP